jgi:hypothetical protein
MYLNYNYRYKIISKLLLVLIYYVSLYRELRQKRYLTFLNSHTKQAV